MFVDFKEMEAIIRSSERANAAIAYAMSENYISKDTLLNILGAGSVQAEPVSEGETAKA